MILTCLYLVGAFFAAIIIGYLDADSHEDKKWMVPAVCFWPFILVLFLFLLPIKIGEKIWEMRNK